MPSIYEKYPELETEFKLLENFLSFTPYLDTVKRVLARCCFLSNTSLPLHILNSGEKSGGPMDNSIFVDLAEHRTEEDRESAEYLCHWITTMETAGIFVMSWECPQSGEKFVNMPLSTQEAAKHLLLDLDPSLLLSAFSTVTDHLRGLFPGRIPADLAAAVDSDDHDDANPAPRPISTPHRSHLAVHITACHATHGTHLTTIPWEDLINGELPAASVDRITALRTLKSTLNDLAWYRLCGDHDYPAAREAAAASVALLAAHYAVEALAPSEAWTQDLDALVVSAYARTWTDLADMGPAGMEGYLRYESPGELTKEFVAGMDEGRAFWERAVEMVMVSVRCEGEAEGDVEVRKRAVEWMDGMYGDAGQRRLEGFRRVEEEYDWDNPVLFDDAGVEKKKKKKGKPAAKKRGGGGEGSGAAAGTSTAVA